MLPFLWVSYSRTLQPPVNRRLQFLNRLFDQLIKLTLIFFFLFFPFSMTQEEMSLWKRGHFYKIQTCLSFLHLTLSFAIAKSSLGRKVFFALPALPGLGPTVWSITDHQA